MKNQLIILWIGIGLLVLAILFPPYKQVKYVQDGGRIVSGRRFVSCEFIFSPPRDNNGIESSRLTAEILIIVLLTAGALYTNRERKINR